MRNKVPVSRENRPPLPDFAPVPLRYRHDGWTPERQRGFIEALADTGCVSRATAIVNMSLEGVYYLGRSSREMSSIRCGTLLSVRSYSSSKPSKRVLN